MPTARLNGETITDWESFHTICAEVFGFPEFYGRNMNAWIDCLSYLRDEDGMSKFRLQENEVLDIELLHSATLRQNAPDIVETLEFCIEDINERYADYGEKPALKLTLR